MQEIPHIPVLYREVLEAFAPCKDGVIVDCTMGYGGHSSLLLENNPSLSLVGIDQDPTAIAFSSKRLEPFGERVEICQGRFSDVASVLLSEKGDKICGILADIGVSSLQLDQRERGFSYESDTLDMRMNPNAVLSAREVVNEYSQSALETILREYGEVSNARRVAETIVQRRPFGSAKELSNAIFHLMPKGKKIHPSTLVMQAIRIEVNDELGELTRLLDAIENSSVKKLRVAIITFHSLEDRIVKNRFSKWSKNCICPDDAMRCTCGNNHAIGKTITKKPLSAQEDELRENSRSRSAKLRIFEIRRD
ncbi:MAG: 16S rRNA (cytosine(1402)-N(4))-methyltransferase RsmH [Sulfuricurvum sp.]|uniref:16S rRNA (cytosine(1402)-N(4))-methyltransferase RsmH n=1 Tax=Sulfuricurvum sp. TaxID=2025608 RepID=UPI0025E49180|nr:16S rRNA (cytosine(1402)-N(4))-methyltransferase RsmH [Sulfuricurvum sp.]MCI4406211.1 16S rRNA (cytosine(1402)-N(4))-methyltransferase RsmH [Sulfuricurvum sp.]